MKKRIISVSFAVLLVFLCCVPAFADQLIADTKGVDVLYNNKLYNDIGVPYFTFSNYSASLGNSVKLNKPFNLDNRDYPPAMTSPYIYATFINNLDLSGLNGVYTGKYYSFGGAESGGRITFSFTFQGQNDNFLKPELVKIEASTLKIFDGEVTTGRTYRYPYPSQTDFTVSSKQSAGSSVSYDYTYTVSFNPDIIGFNFDRIKFQFAFPSGGDYHYTPILRAVSINYISENEYQNSLEKEKDEANTSGNDNVDKLIGGLGDVDDKSLLNAFGDLVSVMSYDGTEAKWMLPAIYLPQIDGVMDRTELMDEKEINLCAFVDKIPESILKLIQYTADIALVVFCCKELYGFIQYLLTLKGGGTE